MRATNRRPLPEAPEQATIVLDCRWLGWSGAGRLTEALLRGLAAASPPGIWVLWGPEETRHHLWPEAVWVPSEARPTAWSGQKEWRRIPEGDLVVFMHQQRPLRRLRSVTMLLDTQPLRFNKGPLDGWIKRTFLRRVVRISDHILTISDFSRRRIEEDLGGVPASITRVPVPVDVAMATRVIDQRELPAQEVALYLGLFLPHKNLERLVEAFAATQMRAAGGQLVLVGGKDRAVGLWDRLTDEQRGWVFMVPQCSNSAVELHLATALLLVQPSLEEGYGLPVAEALAGGVAVCSSNAGALPETARGFAELFDPMSVTDMTAAIDRTAIRARRRTVAASREQSRRYLEDAPGDLDLAEAVMAVVSDCLARSER